MVSHSKKVHLALMHLRHALFECNGEQNIEYIKDCILNGMEELEQ